MSTVAGGVVGIGVVVNLTQFSTRVRVLGLVTALMWAVAAAAFIFASSGSVKFDREGQSQEEPQNVEEFVTGVLSDAGEEQRRLRTRVRWAVMIACLAALLSVATFVSGFIQLPQNAARGVTLVVTSDGRTLFSDHCATGQAGSFIVDVNGLTTTSPLLDVVIVTGAGRGCRLLVPRTSVIGVAFG